MVENERSTFAMSRNNKKKEGNHTAHNATLPPGQEAPSHAARICICRCQTALYHTPFPVSSRLCLFFFHVKTKNTRGASTAGRDMDG